MYKDIIKKTINAGHFELTDTIKKINTLWLAGDLTDDQRDELLMLAREKANPADSYATLQEQIYQLAARITKLEAQAPGETAPIDDASEYPAWKPPTGAHDAYRTGDKMTYTDGKRYVCQMDGCVWGPDIYPAGWALAE